MACWDGQVVQLTLDVMDMTAFHWEIVNAYECDDVDVIKQFVAENYLQFIDAGFLQERRYNPIKTLKIQDWQYFRGDSAYMQWDLNSYQRVTREEGYVVLRFFTSVKSTDMSTFLKFISIFKSAVKCPLSGEQVVAYHIDDDQERCTLVTIDSDRDLAANLIIEHDFYRDSDVENPWKFEEFDFSEAATDCVFGKTPTHYPFSDYEY